jgi:hypothetical protein
MITNVQRAHEPKIFIYVVECIIGVWVCHAL